MKRRGGTKDSHAAPTSTTTKPATPPLVSRRFAVGAIGSGAFAAALVNACTGGSDPPQVAPQNGPQVGPQPPPQVAPQFPPQDEPQPKPPDDAGPDADASDASDASDSG